MAIEFGKGITLAGGFDLGAKAPLDSRLTVATIADRDAHVTGNRAYEGMLVYVEADKITYQYVADAEGNLSWKEFGFNEADFLAHVANDLTTDDASKALSAAQGVALKGLIDAEAEAAREAEEELQTAIDELGAHVGELPEGTSATSVIDYVNIKTAGIATDAALEELNNQVSGLQTTVQGIEADYLTSEDKTELSGLVTTEKERAMGVEEGLRTDVDTIAVDYLKAADKTALEGKINLKADQSALDEVSGVANAAVKQSDYDTKVAALEAEDARIVGLVEAEVERATGIEADFEGRISAMETFWDATEDSDGIVNKLKEIQDYIASDETGAATMAGNIQANTKAIEDMEAAYKDADTNLQKDIDKNKEDIAAEVKRAGEAESVLSDRIDTLEAIDHNAYVGADTALKNELNGEIAKKADASVVSAMDTAYKDADEGLSSRISTLEGKFGTGEGSVSDMISDAIAGEVTRVDGELDKKVDKVTGYGLSENDLTDTLKGQYDAAYQHSLADHAPANAQANIIESVKVNGTALAVTGKAVDILVPTDYLVASDIANKADKATNLAGYGITDAYTITKVDQLLEGKIDKDGDKVLSENDLTDVLKGQYDAAYEHSQAAHAPVNAERNIITGVKVNGSALTVGTDRTINISVPTDNASLANGAGYLVASDISGKADKATTISGYGITDAYTITQTDGFLNAKVDKVDGKGLSTNDLTDVLKQNYDAAYEHSKITHGALVSKDKVSESDLETSLATKINGKADKATTLAGYGIADAYTKDDIDGMFENFEPITDADIEALFKA